jgi:hypothetical protein
VSQLIAKRKEKQRVGTGKFCYELGAVFLLGFGAREEDLHSLRDISCRGLKLKEKLCKWILIPRAPLQAESPLSVKPGGVSPPGPQREASQELWTRSAGRGCGELPQSSQAACGTMVL